MNTGMTKIPAKSSLVRSSFPNTLLFTMVCQMITVPLTTMSHTRTTLKMLPVAKSMPPGRKVPSMPTFWQSCPLP